MPEHRGDLAADQVESQHARRSSVGRRGEPPRQPGGGGRRRRGRPCAGPGGPGRGTAAAGRRRAARSAARSSRAGTSGAGPGRATAASNSASPSAVASGSTPARAIRARSASSSWSVIAAALVPQPPGQRHRGQPGGAPVRGQRVEEGVGRGVVALPGGAQRPRPPRRTARTPQVAVRGSARAGATPRPPWAQHRGEPVGGQRRRPRRRRARRRCAPPPSGSGAAGEQGGDASRSATSQAATSSTLRAGRGQLRDQVGGAVRRPGRGGSPAAAGTPRARSPGAGPRAAPRAPVPPVTRTVPCRNSGGVRRLAGATAWRASRGTETDAVADGDLRFAGRQRATAQRRGHGPRAGRRGRPARTGRGSRPARSAPGPTRPRAGRGRCPSSPTASPGEHHQPVASSGVRPATPGAGRAPGSARRAPPRGRWRRRRRRGGQHRQVDGRDAAGSDAVGARAGRRRAAGWCSPVGVAAVVGVPISCQVRSNSASATPPAAGHLDRAEHQRVDRGDRSAGRVGDGHPSPRSRPGVSRTRSAGRAGGVQGDAGPGERQPPGRPSPLGEAEGVQARRRAAPGAGRTRGVGDAPRAGAPRRRPRRRAASRAQALEDRAVDQAAGRPGGRRGRRSHRFGAGRRPVGEGGAGGAPARGEQAAGVPGPRARRPSALAGVHPEGARPGRRRPAPTHDLELDGAASGSTSGASRVSSSTVSQPTCSPARRASSTKAVPGKSTAPSTAWSASHGCRSRDSRPVRTAPSASASGDRRAEQRVVGGVAGPTRWRRRGRPGASSQKRWCWKA